MRLVERVQHSSIPLRHLHQYGGTNFVQCQFRVGLKRKNLENVLNLFTVNKWVPFAYKREGVKWKFHLADGLY